MAKFDEYLKKGMARLYPYNCCECGKALTPEDCFLVGSANYCEEHCRAHHPAAPMLDWAPSMRAEYYRKTK